MKCDPTIAKTCLNDSLEVLSNVADSDWNNDNLFTVLVNLSQEKGYKKTTLLWAVRIAITGVLNTPGGATEMADVIGKEKTIERIKLALENL